MKKITRTITGLIMASILFSLVSCMGMAEDGPVPSCIGTVVDKDTGEGIENIKITCMDDDGNTGATTRSDDEGEFDLGSDTNSLCGENIVFEDTDGESNGGLYEEKTILYEENDMLVEMELTEE